MSDNKTADVGNWDSDFPPEDKKPKGNGNRIPFMKFNGPGDYTVRLVGNHVKFRRHWSPFTERVITHIDDKANDPAWQAGFYPRETFAIHIIDRADGQLKILEKGRSLFKLFARYKVVNEVNPAGKDGTDWVITVEGSGLNTSYSATAKAKPAPFTEDEIAMIKEGKAPLKTIYQTTPLEKIKELWDALPDEAKIAPKREYDNDNDKPKTEAKATEIKESMPDSPAETEDDLFGDGGDDTGF